MRNAFGTKIMSSITAVGIGLLGGFVGIAKADIGCEIKLCLAAVAGQRPSECNPAMSVLKNLLKKGKPIPQCKEDKSGNVEYGNSYYDYCPEGLKAGTGFIITLNSNNFYIGIGEGDTVRPDENKILPDKVCVGNKLGTREIVIGYDEDNRPIYRIATVFDKVHVMHPRIGNTQYGDVYIDGKVYNRARW